MPLPSAYRILLVSFTTVVFALSASAASVRKKAETAEQQALFGTDFREVIERGVGNGGFQAVAVGVIDGKRRETRYFGRVDGPSSAKPNDESRFEIGAITEVFTGLLLAQAAIEGKLRLNDATHNLLAPGFPFADPALARATLLDLITQKAGLPSRPANLFPPRLDDPYENYATEDLFAFLALQPRSSDATQSQPAGYSVLSVGLLGNLIGRVYATPFPELLESHVLTPLGMSHTSFADEQLLAGHVRGEAAAHWHYGVLAAAAGLRSSLPDLVDFLQRNLVPGDSPLRGALLLARQGRVAVDADQLGLGWKVREVASADDTWPLVWRASETAGFSAFIGFRTDKQRGIVLLGNAAEDLADLGMAWLAELPPPASPHGDTSLTESKLERYPGLYKLNSGIEIVVHADNGTLNLQLPGNWPQRLRLVDKDVFASDNAPLAVTFMRDVDEVTGLVLRINDENVSARRLSARAPRVARAPIEVPKDRLADCAGDYRIGADNWLRVVVQEGGLVVQPTMSERLTLVGYARDRFADANGAVDLSVHRDAQGRLDHLVLDLAGVEREATPLHPKAAATPAATSESRHDSP